MRVFLTGGTGLVGSHVAAMLRREGHEITALVRRDSDVSFLRQLGVRLCVGDLTLAASLTEALRPCESLVHSAALIVAGSSWEVYQRVNVGGTESLFEAAVGAGVKRAVHISTVAVYGGAEVAGRAPVDEEAPLDLPLASGEFYARSKRLADAVASRFQAEREIEVVIVRPALVYGERDRIALPRLARFLRSPVIPLVGGGARALPIVYAGNVAGGIVRAMRSPAAAGRTYNLATDFTISQKDFLRLLAERLGVKPIFVPIPYDAAHGLAWTIERITGALTDRPPFLNRRNVSFMGAGNPFDSRRIRAELGWEPEVDHAEGVRRSVDWYLQGKRAR